jgi:tRNA A37 threonylcarbamoyladenosine modification protein TsaB
MKNLIIDAANEKIFFSIITEIQSYTTTHVNSRENFDKFINLLLDFLKKNKIKLDDVENIFINQGPGKFSGIRISISIAKAISIAKNISLFGFNLKDLDNEDYKKLLKLHKKDLLNKNLIKPLYLS